MSAYQLQLTCSLHSLIPYVSSHRQCSLLPHKFDARTKLLTICMEEKALKIRTCTYNLVDIGCPRTSARRVCGCNLTSSKAH
ncbi:hypothetical protein K435DRAFT_783029 [Dendrothele bispora CBS 962.96]|uniref:Uncharacterized protein n=1 Tax=Dendrothele bispora (strain CBS 962.96) TaxID=1314807 RepID=A0A4S8LBT6_DENBC|nr:hypothetical protein K435DRAFT_783029 [Dendrothele bispora CBS 962.96]